MRLAYTCICIHCKSRVEYSVPIAIWRPFLPSLRLELLRVAEAGPVDVIHAHPHHAALGEGKAVVVVVVGAAADRAYIRRVSCVPHIRRRSA